MSHESSRKCLRLSTLLISEHDKFEATINIFEDHFAILKTEEACYLRFVKKHFTQLFRTQIGVDAAGNDNATLSAFPQKIVALLSKKFVEINICSLLLTIDRRDLILVLLCSAEVGALTRETALVV